MRPSMPRDNFEKHDRLIRLMRELALFQAQPRGLTSAQIAERTDISQRQAQLPHVEHHVVAVVSEVPRGGNFERPPIAAFASHPNALARSSRVPERRLAGRADPLVAAVVALFLLAQPLLEELLDGLAVELIEQGALFVGEGRPSRLRFFVAACCVFSAELTANVES